jgi:predicted DNA-binding transcriptional regulator AlpA
MKDIPRTINEGLIFDGMLFASPGDRCRYIGTTGNKHRERRWREQNPDKWIRIEDIPQSVAAEDVKAAEAPSASAPSPDARGEPKDQDTDGSTEMPASASPAEHVESAMASATAALSSSEIAKNEIAICGHPHVSNPRLASMLGISERTLSRLLRNGDGPPHVKIGGNYYPLDKIPEWAAARGLRLKTPSENH